MRVLQVNVKYSGTGADRCARELYQQLPSVGVETTMWVSERDPSDPAEVLAIRSGWERLLTPLEALPDLTDWRHRGSIQQLQSISRQRFDLVHLHIIHSGWISTRAVKELADRLPTVWTLHDEWAPTRGLTYDLTGKITASEAQQLSRGPLRYLPYHRYHENFKWRRTRKFLKRWMPEPEAVISPSHYMADLAEAAGVFPRSEIVYIPNGTRMPEVPNAAMDRDEAKRSFALRSDQPVVLMISADLAQAHKGVDLGIKAIRGVDPQLGLQTLLLGRSGHAMMQALQPLPSATVWARDDETLARAYRAADITIVPSLGENFPYIGLESLACGTPLVSFPVGGVPEIIGNGERGLVCSAIDAAEMSRHLESLVRNPGLRQAMGERGKQWVHDTCGMTKYLASTKALYERVLSSWNPENRNVRIRHAEDRNPA